MVSSEANVGVSLVPISSFQVNTNIKLPSVAGVTPNKEAEPIQSIEIENDNNCNEIIITLEKDESTDGVKLPLKVTLKKNPGLTSDKTIKVQIVKRTKDN
jgi:hypothetical protein